MTRLDTGAALLRAVLLHPEDDTARLVYADYLDEQGESDRAEFVRVQCALAALERGEPAGKDAMYLLGWRLARDRNAHTLAAFAGEPCGCGQCLRKRERELFDGSPSRVIRWFGLPYGVARVARLEPFDRDEPAFPYSVVRRGFVSEVRCPLAALFGGPCGRCVPGGIPGTLTDGAGGNRRPCPVCRGTGSVPGCAAEVWASQPVTEVTLTDREPWDCGGGFAWWCASGPQVENRGSLPDELFDLLDGHRQHGGHTYPTRDDALAALSRAAVRLGRQRAGLDPCGRCGGEGRVGRHWDPASDTMRGGKPCPVCRPTSG